MSGVVLTVNPAVLAAPKGFLNGVIPVDPTTQRDFTSTDRVSAFVRVYTAGRKAAVGEITTTIVDDEDREVYRARESISSAALSISAERYFPLPLRQLPPGPYLLRIVLTGDKRPITRDVRFAMR